MPNVMIVEDDLSIADLLQQALELEGYCVVGIARTAEEAIKLVAQQQTDFAVIDIHLANGALGIHIGAHLRKTTTVGVLFSTGYDYVESMTKTNGDAVMKKPYRLRDVGRALQIIDELARFGQTQHAFPRSFRLLTSAAAA
jgi:DNA-binding response OmpR family regulator